MKAQLFGLMAVTGLVHIASAGVTSTFAVSGWKHWEAPVSSTANSTIPSYPPTHPTTTKEHPKPTDDCEYEDDDEDYCPPETWKDWQDVTTYPAPPAETHPAPPAETHPSPPAETHPPPAETHPTTTYAPPAETHPTTTYAPPAQTTSYVPPTYTGAAEKNKMAGVMLVVPALAMMML